MASDSTFPRCLSSFRRPKRAFEAQTGKELPLQTSQEGVRLQVPDFAIAAYVVAEY